MKLTTYLFIALFCAASSVIAQEQLTEHTYHLPKDAPIGHGKLEDVAWLVHGRARHLDLNLKKCGIPHLQAPW